MIRTFVACGLSLFLAACSSGATPPSFSSQGAASHAGRVTFRIKVPKKQPALRVRVRAKRHAKPAYVSAYTQAMTLAIHGPTTQSLTIGLTVQTPGCSPTPGGFECTSSALLDPCPNGVTRCYTAGVSTWDAYDAASNTIPAGANELSTDQDAAFSVVAGQQNTVGFTLSGIPAQLLIVPANDATTVGAGTITLAGSGAHPFTAQALDADQETIAGPGSPTFSVTVSGPLAVTATQPSGQSRTFTLTPPASYNPSDAALLTVDAAFPAESTDACAAAGAVCQTHVLVYTKALIANFPLDHTASAAGIAWGADGNLWFTESRGTTALIGKISTYGVVTEYSAGITAGAQPAGIAAGPDGYLWFAETGTSKIGRISTNGVVTEYSTGFTGAPVNITLGPDKNLWFTETNVSRIGTITTSGVATDYPVTTAKSGVTGIASGPDNNLWFTECRSNQIGAMTTLGVMVNEYPVASADFPTGIAAGPDNNLWYTATSPAAIGKITTSGTITEYTSEFQTNDTTASAPNTIAAGPDGDLWFTELLAPNIGKVTTNGAITEYGGMTGSGAMGIVAGPDSNLWFTEAPAPGLPAIGRLTP